MKTLLKLCVVAVMLVLGVSSCLKEDDSLNIAFDTRYLLQTEEGVFVPQMRLRSAELKSASLSVDGKTFNFKSLTDPSFYWEIPSSLTGLDLVSSASNTLTLTGIDGKIETHKFAFDEATEKIGEIAVDSLAYDPEENHIYIELDAKVENTLYYLMIKSPIGEKTSQDYAMWMPYSFSFEEDALSITIPCEKLLAKDVTYRVAIGAGYGSAIKVGEETVAKRIK